MGELSSLKVRSIEPGVLDPPQQRVIVNRTKLRVDGACDRHREEGGESENADLISRTAFGPLS